MIALINKYHIIEILITYIMMCIFTNCAYRNDQRNIYLSSAIYIGITIDVSHENNSKFTIADGCDENTLKKVLCQKDANCNIIDTIIKPQFTDYYYKGDIQSYYLILVTPISYNNKFTLIKIDPKGIYWEDYILDKSIKAKMVDPNDIKSMVVKYIPKGERKSGGSIYKYLGFPKK
jgi:hypothetical protein